MSLPFDKLFIYLLYGSVDTTSATSLFFIKKAINSWEELQFLSTEAILFSDRKQLQLHRVDVPFNKGFQGFEVQASSEILNYQS